MTTPQKKLMIVDDSRTSRMLIEKFVKSLRPDWQFFEAATGEEALATIGEIQPTYVTMDVNMPGMSGLEAAGHIRFLYPDVRITICTGNVQEYVRVAAENAGVHFIPKPITLLSMAEAINYFEKPPAAPPPEPDFDSLS
jgi:two-component system, chemotaxis family, chemotaxis protein CheY